MPRSPRAILSIPLLLLCSCPGDRGGHQAGRPAPVARAARAGAASLAAATRQHPAEVVLYQADSDWRDERAFPRAAVATLHGDVLLAGRLLCRHPFEVRLTPIPNPPGGHALRKLFGDGSGSFRLWPPPGRYFLQVFAGDLVSRPRVVDLAPGNPGERLRIAMCNGR